MGRSYLFECERCGYRAKVSGKADRGVNCWVQTILCRDCKALYDAVTRLRVPDESPLQSSWRNLFGLRRQSFAKAQGETWSAPSFQAVLNQLPPKGVRRFKWVQFKPRCPVSWIHKVEVWNEPNQCPKCGLHMDKTVLPYRLWD